MAHITGMSSLPPITATADTTGSVIQDGFTLGQGMLGDHTVRVGSTSLSAAARQTVDVGPSPSTPLPSDAAPGATTPANLPPSIGEALRQAFPEDSPHWPQFQLAAHMCEHGMIEDAQLENLYLAGDTLYSTDDVAYELDEVGGKLLEQAIQASGKYQVPLLDAARLSRVRHALSHPTESNGTQEPVNENPPAAQPTTQPAASPENVVPIFPNPIVAEPEEPSARVDASTATTSGSDMPAWAPPDIPDRAAIHHMLRTTNFTCSKYSKNQRSSGLQELKRLCVLLQLPPYGLLPNQVRDLRYHNNQVGTGAAQAGVITDVKGNQFFLNRPDQIFVDEWLAQRGTISGWLLIPQTGPDLTDKRMIRFMRSTHGPMASITLSILRKQGVHALSELRFLQQVGLPGTYGRLPYPLKVHGACMSELRRAILEKKPDWADSQVLDILQNVDRHTDLDELGRRHGVRFLANCQRLLTEVKRLDDLLEHNLFELDVKKRIADYQANHAMHVAEYQQQAVKRKQDGTLPVPSAKRWAADA